MRESNSLPARLKELRKLHGYTQDYVAAALGIVRQTYSHYETGRRIPKYDVLFKISELYSISLDNLMDIVDNQDNDALADKGSSDNELSKMLDYFEQPINKQRFRNFSKLEKELLYYFERLPDIEKKELVEIAKMKHRHKGR